MKKLAWWCRKLRQEDCKVKDHLVFRVSSRLV